MDDKTPVLIGAAQFAWRGEADDGERNLFIPG